MVARSFNPGQRAAAARRHRDKAVSFLRSAELLFGENEWESAISRAYYAVFHLVLSAAVQQGLAQPRTSYAHNEVAGFAGAVVPASIIVPVPSGMNLPHEPKAAYIALVGYRVKADYWTLQMGTADAGIALAIARNFFQAVEVI